MELVRDALAWVTPVISRLLFVPTPGHPSLVHLYAASAAHLARPFEHADCKSVC